MTFAERNRKFLLKLQSLPDSRKKIILWTIVAVLAIIMGYFWVNNAKKNFSKISENLGSIEIPKIDTPEIPIFPDEENLIK